jgi:methylthioxylose transferase
MTPADDEPRTTGTGVAVAAATALVGGCALAGWWLTVRGAELHLGNTFPVTGRYQPHLSAWLLAPLLVAAAVWYAGPRLAARLPWTGVLLAGYLCAVVWAVALARVGGPDAVATPLTSRWEYLAEVSRIDAMGIAAYLRGFTDFIVEGAAGPGWANHVAGHPPLLTLLFVLLARAGLAGPGWAAALCIAVGAATVPAVLSTTRLMAGEDWARRAAPFVAAAPLALWIATSADAIIAGVAAAGIATLAHATARTGAASLPLAGLGGLALGTVLMLSYGMALLSVVVLAVVVALRGWRDAWPPLAAATIGVVAVLAGFAAAGFWWFEGLGLTADRVRIGEGWSDRPTGYFLFANPAALAVAVGPAVVAALALLRQAPTRLVVPAVAALVAVGLALASNLSKGEVERIWLPYAVWLLPLTALLPRTTRGWLAAHLAWPVVLAAGTTLSW